MALLTLELVSIPTDENMSELQVRDADDRPILRAAIAARAEILLTGDKDFLESGLKNPRIMTPAEFLNMS
jgi:predicted nucleic acid-binding protein